jgi:hypothetical protein
MPIAKPHELRRPRRRPASIRAALRVLYRRRAVLIRSIDQVEMQIMQEAGGAVELGKVN